MLAINFTNALRGGELSHTKHVITSDEGIEEKSTRDVVFCYHY